jgi:Tfp pilus assembly protein PilX
METKKSEEILSEIYRNCHLALESISDILPEIEDKEIKAEIEREHEEYEKICGKAACLAKNKALDLKEPNPMKKAMMWGSIKMNTLTDNSRAHIAEMMIQGTVMGITSLKTSLSELPQDDDEEITSLLKELIALEEGFEKKLKEFL